MKGLPPLEFEFIIPARCGFLSGFLFDVIRIEFRTG